MPFAEKIWFEESGKGDPVLFVHGWCMSSKIWQLQMEEVCKKYRAIALDLRGHGNSHPLPVNSFADYGADINNVVNLLDLERLTLVGWSMGGQVLLKILAGIRDRVSRLVLVGSTPRFTASPGFPNAVSVDEARGMRVRVSRNPEKSISNFKKSMFADGELQDPETARQVDDVLGAVSPPSREAALDGLERLMDEDLSEEATQIDLPTLLVHGELDRICLPAASKWLEQRISGGKRICYQGCGHAPFLSRPQRFNQDLQNFISGTYD